MDIKRLLIKFFILSSLLITFKAFGFDLQKFQKELGEASKIYEASQKGEIRTLFIQGKVSFANEKLINLVKDKNFYDYFILANMLFVSEPEASYDYMKKAEKIKPNNPWVQFERGIHEHRLNNFNKAREYYQKFLDSDFGKGNYKASAYITHTNLMTNRIEESFISWKQANFSNNHTSIEKAMYHIFSDLNQEKKREQLIKDIRSGQAFKLCDLWLLDLNWESDWWNSGPRQMYLEFDKELTNNIIKETPHEKPFIDFCSKSENLTADNILSQLNKIGINTEKKNLPKSSSLIYEILFTLMRNDLMSELEFLEIFEDHLQMLASKYPDDPDYLKTLAYLYTQTRDIDKLQKVNLLGWKKHRISNYAVSYAAEMSDESKKKNTLENALKDFPNDPTLNQYYMSLYGMNDKTVLARFVASQFSNVKYNWMEKYRLKDYMASLKYEIDKLENTE